VGVCAQRKAGALRAQPSWYAILSARGLGHERLFSNVIFPMNQFVVSSSYTCYFFLALLASFFVVANVTHAAELFSDGFESDFTAWDSRGVDWVRVSGATYAAEGNYRGEGRGSANTGSELIKYLSTIGHEYITLTFWYQIPDNGYEVGEDMTISFTTDGGANWLVVKQFTDGDEVGSWTELTVPLPAVAADQENFGIKFRTNAGAASDVFKLDAVRINGEVIVVEEPDTDVDGILDVQDNCPLVSNREQLDFDADGSGDECDSDDDNDGLLDVDEKNGCQQNSDTTCGVVVEVDEDTDGIIEEDLCPYTKIDQAGSDRLLPNHWRYTGAGWMKGSLHRGIVRHNVYTMNDTRGCSCDQILEVLSGHFNKPSKRLQKFGCPSGLIEEFMSQSWSHPQMTRTKWSRKE
jgi:hypothetical protein